MFVDRCWVISFLHDMMILGFAFHACPLKKRCLTITRPNDFNLLVFPRVLVLLPSASCLPFSQTGEKNPLEPTPGWPLKRLLSHSAGDQRTAAER